VVIPTPDITESRLESVFLKEVISSAPELCYCVLFA